MQYVSVFRYESEKSGRTERGGGGAAGLQPAQIELKKKNFRHDIRRYMHDFTLWPKLVTEIG
jgi:hypothetical protein